MKNPMELDFLSPKIPKMSQFWNCCFCFSIFTWPFSSILSHFNKTKHLHEETESNGCAPYEWKLSNHLQMHRRREIEHIFGPLRMICGAVRVFSILGLANITPAMTCSANISMLSTLRAIISKWVWTVSHQMNSIRAALTSCQWQHTTTSRCVPESVWLEPCVFQKWSKFVVALDSLSFGPSWTPATDEKLMNWRKNCKPLVPLTWGNEPFKLCSVVLFFVSFSRFKVSLVYRPLLRCAADDNRILQLKCTSDNYIDKNYRPMELCVVGYMNVAHYKKEAVERAVHRRRYENKWKMSKTMMAEER